MRVCHSATSPVTNRPSDEPSRYGLPDAARPAETEQPVRTGYLLVLQGWTRIDRVRFVGRAGYVRADPDRHTRATYRKGPPGKTREHQEGPERPGESSMPQPIGA